jgi:hypothetical protein
MAHNIEGFEEHNECIKTVTFYIKGSGQVQIDNKVLVIAETEKAILIREKIQFDKEEYSIKPFWLAKSLIVSRSEYYPKYQEAYNSYVRITKELGGTVDFTYEQYLKLALSKN